MTLGIAVWLLLVCWLITATRRDRRVLARAHRHAAEDELRTAWRALTDADVAWLRSMGWVGSNFG